MKDEEIIQTNKQLQKSDDEMRKALPEFDNNLIDRTWKLTRTRSNIIIIMKKNEAWLKEKEELEKIGKEWYKNTLWWQDMALEQRKAIDEFREEKQKLEKALQGMTALYDDTHLQKINAISEAKKLMREKKDLIKKILEFADKNRKGYDGDLIEIQDVINLIKGEKG